MGRKRKFLEFQKSTKPKTLCMLQVLCKEERKIGFIPDTFINFDDTCRIEFVVYIIYKNVVYIVYKNEEFISKNYVIPLKLTKHVLNLRFSLFQTPLKLMEIVLKI